MSAASAQRVASFYSYEGAPPAVPPSVRRAYGSACVYTPASRAVVWQAIVCAASWAPCHAAVSAELERRYLEDRAALLRVNEGGREYEVDLRGMTQRDDPDWQAAALQRQDFLGDEGFRQARITLQDEGNRGVAV